jgi:hypothetical protein
VSQVALEEFQISNFCHDDMQEMITGHWNDWSPEVISLAKAMLRWEQRSARKHHLKQTAKTYRLQVYIIFELPNLGMVFGNFLVVHRGALAPEFELLPIDWEIISRFLAIGRIKHQGEPVGGLLHRCDAPARPQELERELTAENRACYCQWTDGQVDHSIARLFQ